MLNEHKDPGGRMLGRGGRLWQYGNLPWLPGSTLKQACHPLSLKESSTQSSGTTRSGGHDSPCPPPGPFLFPVGQDPRILCTYIECASHEGFGSVVIGRYLARDLEGEEGARAASCITPNVGRRKSRIPYPKDIMPPTLRTLQAWVWDRSDLRPCGKTGACTAGVAQWLQVAVTNAEEHTSTTGTIAAGIKTTVQRGWYLG